MLVSALVPRKNTVEVLIFVGKLRKYKADEKEWLRSQ